MKSKQRHNELILFIVIAFTFLLFIASYADTVTNTYDDVNHKIREDYGTPIYSITATAGPNGSIAPRHQE